MVRGCFGNRLRPGWQQVIDEFRAAYLATGLSMTTKLHVILSHVRAFCELKGVGLGIFSEQPGETLHHDFLKTLANINPPKKKSHPNYGAKVKKAFDIVNGRNAMRRGRQRAR